MNIYAFINIFVENLLPIFLAAGIGYVFGRTMRPDIKTASRLAFYVFSPCLVFSTLVRIGISGSEIRQLALFTFGSTALMISLAYVTGKIMRLERHLLATLIIASVFVNGANYGLAATKFAFGEQALACAMVYFVFNVFALYTVGIVIASMGRLSWKQALGKMIAIPAFYALITAAMIRYTGYGLPLFVDRAVTLLSDAAIPTMLVILGLQLAETRSWPHHRIGLISAATVLQLVMAPLVALLLAHWVGLTGPARQAAVLQSSMPTAVITTILAIEYELDTPMVAGTVILTTLLSPLTLTPLIAYLLNS
jgi:malate permease and related proteins